MSLFGVFQYTDVNDNHNYVAAQVFIQLTALMIAMAMTAQELQQSKAYRLRQILQYLCRQGAESDL